jgi:hypothetical protein
MDAVLIPTSQTDLPFNGRAPSPYTKAFTHWAVEHFHPVWLTDESPRTAFMINDHLGLKEHDIPVLTFDTLKTESLDPKSHFYLVDDALTPGEISWFMEHKRGDSVIPIHPREGITPTTKQQLEERAFNVHR